jgi:hypothetical protein
MDYVLWIRPSSGRLCVDLTGDGDRGPLLLLNLIRRDAPAEPLLHPNDDSKMIASITLMKYHHMCSIHLPQSITSSRPLVGLKTVNCFFSKPGHGASIQISFNFDFPVLNCGWYFPRDGAMVMENGWTR